MYMYVNLSLVCHNFILLSNPETFTIQIFVFTIFFDLIAGLDYLAHNDILPYSTNERHPIHHELFNKFLMHDPGGCKYLRFKNIQ